MKCQRILLENRRLHNHLVITRSIVNAHVEFSEIFINSYAMKTGFIFFRNPSPIIKLLLVSL